MAETETLTIFLETRPRRDVGTSRDRLETETTTLVNRRRLKFYLPRRTSASMPPAAAVWSGALAYLRHLKQQS